MRDVRGRRATEADVAQILLIASRAGELLLRSGASAADTVSTTTRITRAFGLDGCLVDVTLTALSLSHRSGPRSAPMTELRLMRAQSVSYTRIQQIHGFVSDVEQGRIHLGKALGRLDEIENAPPAYPDWMVTLAWAALSGFFTVMLGGGPAVFLSACATAVLVDQANRWLSSRNVPLFHQAVFGGAAATAMATALFLGGASDKAALIVAGGIAVMLPGLAFTGGVQDGIQGYLVTAVARAFDAALVTAGLVAGVGVVLYAAVRLGLKVPEIQPGGLDLGGWRMLPLQFVAAGMVCVCLALCFQASWRGLVTAGLAGGIGWLLFLALWQHLKLPIALAAAMASALIGATSLFLDRVSGTPAHLTIIAGIAPMAPGYIIYQGMLQLSRGELDPGVITIGMAAAIGLGLAAGVTFGQTAAGLRSR